MARTVNKAKQALYFEALRAGRTRREAAAIAGVERSTLWRWAEHSAAFGIEQQRAEGDWITAQTRIIERAAARSWRAAAWLLEHRSEEWMPRSTLKVEGVPDGEALTDDERNALNSVHAYLAMTEDERLVDFHTNLRLSLLMLTSAGWLDLRAFGDEQFAGRHVGHIDPVPVQKLPNSVGGSMP